MIPRVRASARPRSSQGSSASICGRSPSAPRVITASSLAVRIVGCAPSSLRTATASTAAGSFTAAWRRRSIGRREPVSKESDREVGYDVRVTSGDGLGAAIT
ncbi:hypothetical protein CTI14_37850, partial [Methylobacterium radiotolerans]